MAKIYPIGVQNFAEIREGGFVYIDKTEFIHKLVSSGKYFFLSRPRRFGKSLLISTIEAFFQGRKELFDGLAISRYDHDWQPRPVLHLDLTGRNYSDEHSLRAHIEEHFRQWEAEYNIQAGSTEPEERFRNLIRSASEQSGRKVVILIDEYDKPLLDTITNVSLQDMYRSQLKAIYGNLKKMDAYIEFAMLTGVTKFGKLSIFSDLNNLQDISIINDYSAICGMTADEIAGNLNRGVAELAAENGLTVSEAYEELKRNYDGYHFAPKSPDIYNPFSLLNALSSRQIGAYWFATGTPTFLVEMIKNDRMQLKDFNNYETDINRLESVPENLRDAIPVLYQSGYLTIKGYDREFDTVTLSYPNREVERGFLDMLFAIYTNEKSAAFSIKHFVMDVRSGNVDGFMERLRSLFSDYKYSQMDLGNLELHYRNVVYLVMKLMGFHTEAELQTASGRIDLTVRTADYLYLFEFKLNGTSREAMDQINSRDYQIPFKADGRRIIKVGANFDDRMRTISDWIVE